MIEVFEKIVGKENVSEERADKEVYAVDSSRINGNTNLVIWPTEAKQIHQIILFAKRVKLNLIPRGGGTNLVGSTIPNNAIVMDLSKMNKILEIGSNYIVVEPGVIVDDLNKKLKYKCFPIVPYSGGIATIGGMISTNAGCPRSLKYGRMKDWVEEVEIIDGTGRKRTLNEVVGREGTLGIIISAKLKLADKLTNTDIDVFKFESVEELAEKVMKLKNDKNIISMEFINELAAKLNDLDEKNYLFVEYEFKENVTKDDTRIEIILEKRKNIANNIIANGYFVEEDITIPLENIAEFLYWAKHKEIPCFGHIANGIIHPCLKSREDRGSLYNMALRLQGELTGEYGIGVLKKEYMAEKKAELMKLKKEYDPLGIFNMGKLIDSMEEKKKVFRRRR